MWHGKSPGAGQAASEADVPYRALAGVGTLLTNNPSTAAAAKGVNLAALVGSLASKQVVPCVRIWVACPTLFPAVRVAPLLNASAESTCLPGALLRKAVP